MSPRKERKFEMESTRTRADERNKISRIPLLKKQRNMLRKERTKKAIHILEQV